MLVIWAAIVSLTLLAVAAFGFIDVPEPASEIARIVLYVLLALVLILLVIGLILVQKAKSLARGFGLNLSWTAMWGIIRSVQLLRKRR